MKKLNFNMEEIKLFDSFAGIGALHQSLKELGVPIKLTGISEVDIDAIISYASIHIDNFKDITFDYPSDDEMRKVLMDRNIGYDFKKNKSKIPRLNKNKLKSCFKATMLLNNLGDIGKLDCDNIPDFDLFNFSFPCQNISIAGKQEGMKKEDGSITKSGTALKLEQNYRLRRLTPTECWRLMGFRDEHINKAIELGISDSQLYKQAGNSIVVNVLYFIFKNLFRDYIK
ncbi:DNA cytosine methyltransferase [Clostridium tetani]|uniref:DNA cytosine methyltransferase n=1 Tax=Clostridium tetani TaxID=1513 RepID=UPI0037C1A0C2